MPLTLQTIIPPTRSGRTFFAASLLLGLGAVVQLVLMGVFLLRGGSAVRRPAVAEPPLHFAETVQPGITAAETPAPSSLPAPTPAPVGVVADSLATLPTGGAPVRPTPVAEDAAQSTANALIEQSRQLRQRGDMPSALARLREAQVAEPENPQVIAEMAYTYEKMQLADRAFEQWQRLYNMGDSIGVLYALADSRLHAAPPAPAPAAPAGGGVQSPAGALAGTTNNLPFQETTVLKITDIHLDEVPDPNAEKKLVLKIVVKDRPGSAIDPTKVRILTYFYDLLDGKDIVLTDAQTDYAWVTPAPINWAGDKSEVLETTYFRAKGAPGTPAPEASAAPSATPAHAARHGAHSKKPDADAATPAPTATPAPVRTYLGYVVRLYYDRQLQDVQADPVRLLQQYPPPLTLPASD